MQHQLDLFEQPTQPDLNRYSIRWEEKEINSKTLQHEAETHIRTLVQLDIDSLKDFVKYIKSCHSYCGWHHIVKTN